MRVLLVGYDPQTVDFSDPALPPGMTAEKIDAGIQLALKQMAGRGWQADVCFIRPDHTAGQTIERQLASRPMPALLSERVSGCRPKPCDVRNGHQRSP